MNQGTRFHSVPFHPFSFFSTQLCHFLSLVKVSVKDMQRLPFYTTVSEDSTTCVSYTQSIRCSCSTMAPQLLQRPLVALLLFLGCVAALKDDNNKGSGFTYPVQEGLTFYEKDSVNVSWTTKFKSASLLVFCWGGAKENELNMSK